jgi:hypothetical protein
MYLSTTEKRTEKSIHFKLFYLQIKFIEEPVLPKYAITL